MAAGPRPARPAAAPAAPAAPTASAAARRPTRPPPHSRIWLPLLVLSFVMAAAGAPAKCGAFLEACSESYSEAEKRFDNPCAPVLQYSACIKQSPRNCRGDLFFHSTESILRKKIMELNCTLGGEGRAPPEPPTVPPPPPAPTQRAGECDFKGRQEFRHCLLFGDPHLKTFFSEFQTCRVKGAWPLIDNPYLAVQVTNEQVRPNSPATATTKVTIVIRGKEHPCAQEKTYQATWDTPALPTTFIDGTQRSSGPDAAIALHVISPEHIEIRVRYLDAVLVVRQSGRWLAFSARLPVELLVGQSDDIQLCVRGCPADEQLAPVARGAAMSHAAAWARCREAGAGGGNNSVVLTDEYLDWCIFDVMTTGDEEADFFTAAAYHAQEDVLRLDPTSLRNRTTARSPSEVLGPSAPARASSGPERSALAALLAALLAAAAAAHARL